MKVAVPAPAFTHIRTITALTDRVQLVFAHDFRTFWYSSPIGGFTRSQLGFAVPNRLIVVRLSVSCFHNPVSSIPQLVLHHFLPMQADVEVDIQVFILVISHYGNGFWK